MNAPNDRATAAPDGPDSDRRCRDARPCVPTGFSPRLVPTRTVYPSGVMGRGASGGAMMTMPVRYGWASRQTHPTSISSRIDGDRCHSSATIRPQMFRYIRPQTISPKRHVRSCEQIVTKYAAGGGSPTPAGGWTGDCVYLGRTAWQAPARQILRWRSFSRPIIDAERNGPTNPAPRRCLSFCATHGPTPASTGTTGPCFDVTDRSEFQPLARFHRVPPRPPLRAASDQTQGVAVK